MEHHLNLPGIAVLRGILALGILESIFFNQIVAGDVYLDMLQEFVDRN